jgi:predicted GNAT family N-acyltransferase
MSSILIRPYELSDRDACLAAFVSNMPRYFADNELPDFQRWLEGPAERYFVVEREGKVLGCGGYAWNERDEDISMTWGMIHNEAHGQGLGHALTVHRLEEAASRYPGGKMRCETSQHTEAFYARFGFQRTLVTPDGFGPGIDKILMYFHLPA